MEVAGMPEEFPSTPSRTIEDSIVGDIIEEVDVHQNEDKISYKATGQIKWTGKEEGSEASTAFQAVGKFNTVGEAFTAGFEEADRKIANMKSGKL
jgi:hypothetical protein